VSLYLEDIVVGTEYLSDEVTVTAEEIIAFATQFDPQPFHLDAEAAKDSFFGTLVASGWHTASITMRLLVTSGPQLAGGTIGAGGTISWPSATLPNDRLHVRITVVSLAPSKSNPSRGSLVMKVETLTDKGELRQHFDARIIVLARSQG
jgi:acyl dehydratase